MTTPVAARRFRFAAFELDPAERRLLAEGVPVHLGPHAFDLLVTLVERSGRLVAKEELRALVWGKVLVEENTLQSHISALRKVLGASVIATVSGRGYRFALEVTPLDTPASTGSPAATHNLPHDLSSFVGREKEIAEITRFLGDTRLLTLTGSGGCGKTRLAIHVARRQAHQYSDGAWLVELAALADAALLPQTVANVLGVKASASVTLIDALQQHLASRTLLLVLDNAEHLIDGCAQLAESLLQRCAQLVVLVTSRERLRIGGEQTFRVPSLTVPDVPDDATPESIVACEAARLFIDRVRQQVPHFAATAQNAAAIASTCCRLDGIPLAIELAAPRVRSMSVQEVSRRLDERFSLLTEGSRTALPRHQTLRSLIDWSCELLNVAERALLYRLSVFAGGWTLESAEQVCAGEAVNGSDVLALLMSLVDKSLVVADERYGEMRYGMLETVRHYARDRLRERGDEGQMQARHLACYLAFAEDAQLHLHHWEQQSWFDRVAREHDNLRAAMAWSADGTDGASGGLRIATAIWRFWDVRGHLAEGRAWLSRLLANAPEMQAPAVRANALRAAGAMAYLQREYPESRVLLEKALQTSRDLGDRRSVSSCLNHLGTVARYLGDRAQTRMFYEEALAIDRELGDTRGIAIMLSNLGVLAHSEGDFASARALYEESLVMQRTLGSGGSVALLLNNLGDAVRRLGDLALARTLFEEGLVIQHGLGDRARMASLLEGLGDVAFAQGEQADAIRLWGRATRLREEVGVPIPGTIGTEFRNQLAVARASVGDAAFDAAWEAGWSADLQEVISGAVGRTQSEP